MLGCHSGAIIQGCSQIPTLCRTPMVGVVPACPLSWAPGLAWKLPVTSARDCDITGDAGKGLGASSREQLGSQQDGGPQKE